MKRRELHRVVFLAAAAYNMLWGCVTALHPMWLFRFARMDPPRYPEIFACLGMVIGLYGILYYRVARDPESGFWPALVGLTGKVLGPIGFAALVIEGSWPPRSAVLILTNDLIWWIPFGLYIHDLVAAGCVRRGADIYSPTPGNGERDAGDSRGG